MRKLLISFGFVLAACGTGDPYEESVADEPPIYCYRVLSGIQCHATPDHEARARLVNYYGPHPRRYDAREKPPKPELSAPAKVEYWVKDPEPIPEPQVYLPMKSSLPPRLVEGSQPDEDRPETE
jgi:hypothetical protein